MSTLVTNTITGLSTAANITIGSTPVVSASANSLTIRGEGSNQTSVQQGIAKCWIDYTTASSFVINDSFNVASITDQGAGDATINISTDMASANYSVTSSTLGGLTNGTKIFQNGAKAAGTYRQISTQADGTAGDIGSSYATIHGDLA
jgi:hypothetical protein